MYIYTTICIIEIQEKHGLPVQNSHLTPFLSLLSACTVNLLGTKKHSPFIPFLVCGLLFIRISLPLKYLVWGIILCIVTPLLYDWSSDT